jgi:hypothetical protein
MRHKALLLFIILGLSSSYYMYHEVDLVLKRGKEEALRAHDTEHDRWLRGLKELFASRVEGQYGLYCASLDFGRDEKWSIECYADRRGTVEEARALLLLVLQDFKQASDSPSVREKPVAIRLHFRDSNHRTYVDGSLSRATYGCLASDQLCYYSEDLFQQDSIKLFNESFEEAVEQNAQYGVFDPAIHKSTEKETELDRVLLSFARDMEKKYGFISGAIGGKMTGAIQEISATFTAYRKPADAQERAIILDMTEQLLSEINKNETLQPYLEERPFPIERLNLRISYEQKRGSFPNRGYEPIAALAFVQGKLIYINGPGSPSAWSWPGWCQSTSTESFEDALEKQEAAR